MDSVARCNWILLALQDPAQIQAVERGWPISCLLAVGRMWCSAISVFVHSFIHHLHICLSNILCVPARPSVRQWGSDDELSSCPPSLAFPVSWGSLFSQQRQWYQVSVFLVWRSSGGFSGWRGTWPLSVRGWVGGTREGKLNKYLRLEQMGLQLGWMLAVMDWLVFLRFMYWNASNVIAFGDGTLKTVIKVLWDRKGRVLI